MKRSLTEFLSRSVNLEDFEIQEVEEIKASFDQLSKFIECKQNNCLRKIGLLTKRLIIRDTPKKAALVRQNLYSV